MSNAQFQNAYVEVLLDNFVSVVKQNVYLQAQQKVAEQTVEKAGEINVQANNLAENNIALQAEIRELKQQLENTKTLEDRVARCDEYKKEQDRIQASLNDFMRKNKALQDEITEQNLNYISKLNNMSDDIIHQKSHIDNLNNYIITLEQNIPVTKLKKIKSSDSVKIEDAYEIRNGGTF